MSSTRRALILASYISITPLGLDLTDAPELERLSAALPLDAPPAEEPTEAVEEDE
jgi:hypothetical protein